MPDPEQTSKDIRNKNEGTRSSILSGETTSGTSVLQSLLNQFGITGALNQLAGEQEVPSTNVLDNIPSRLLESLRSQGFTDDQIITIYDNAVKDIRDPITALQGVLNQQLQNIRLQQQVSPSGEQQINQPRSFEELQVNAILDGNYELAQQVRRFEQNPSDFDALQAALQVANTPGDVFTLSAIARGQFPRAFPTSGNVAPLPLSPSIQGAAQRFFGGVDGTLPIPGQVAPPVDQTQTPAFQQQAANQFIPPAQRISAGLHPDQVTFGQGAPGGTLSPEDLSRLTREQVQFLGGSINQNQPLPSGFTPPPFVDTTPPELRMSAGITPEQVSFQSGAPGERLSPEQLAQLTPEQVSFLGGQSSMPEVPLGIPSGSINFGGVQRALPIGINQLFEGIKGGQVIERPKSFLGSVGLPLPSAQAFRNLSAAEQDEFFALARQSGLDPRDVQRELQSTIPAPQSRRRVTFGGS